MTDWKKDLLNPAEIDEVEDQDFEDAFDEYIQLVIDYFIDGSTTSNTGTGDWISDNTQYTGTGTSSTSSTSVAGALCVIQDDILLFDGKEWVTYSVSWKEADCWHKHHAVEKEVVSSFEETAQEEKSIIDDYEKDMMDCYVAGLISARMMQEAMNKTKRKR
jgi:hypothetical protein